jgi:hypothetical protein
VRETFLMCVLVAAVTAVAVRPAAAHHSFAAEFDITKPVTLVGTVTKIEWTNPHVYIYVDVEDAQTRAVANWAIELGSTNGLTRLGWTRNMLKPGDGVTVQGSLGRFKPHLANARTFVMTATGQRLGAASSEAAR